MDEALRRLEAAIDRLEGRLDGLFDRLETNRGHEREADALRVDRARLASDLDSARARERELQRLADEASEALGAAISEVREALGKV
jgi:chromosome segregation ATPase